MSVLFDWRQAVFDSDLPAPAKLVALALSQDMNGEGEQAWPSIARLVTRTSLSERAVQYAVRRLARGGWIAVERHAGTSSHYFATTPAPPAPLQEVPPAPVAPPHLLHPTPAPHAPTPAPHAPDLVNTKPSTKPRTKDLVRAAREPDPEPPDFVEFYERVYPRKQGRGAARRAWAGAVRKVSAAVLLDAADRFAADPNREDQYTPHPSTWLNQERWEDAPLPARAPPPPRLLPLDQAYIHLQKEIANAAHDETGSDVRRPAGRMLPRVAHHDADGG